MLNVMTLEDDLTLEEAAVLAHRTTRAIQRWIADPRIALEARRERPGRRILIDRNQLVAVVKRTDDWRTAPWSLGDEV